MTRKRQERKITAKGRQTALSFFKELPSAIPLREDPVIKEVHRSAEKKGYEVYLVGGALRNIAMGKPLVPDYDFIFEGDIKAFSEEVARALHGTSFLLDKETSSYRVAFKSIGPTLDFSPIKENDIIYDLKKRDFTVNAMALALSGLFTRKKPLILDPCNGVEDSASGILRVSSKGVIREDPLRALRAIRLSQQYRLKISGETVKLINASGGLLKRTSAERVREELVLIFLYPGTAGSLKSIFSSGIVEAILPGLKGWEDINGYDLLDHALKTVDEAESIIGGISRKKRGVYLNLKEHFGGSVGSLKRAAYFKLAAFLHDIGKPHNMTREAGRLRFIGHDLEGSRVVKDVLMRLKFSRKVAGGLSNLVRNHHRIFIMADLKERTNRARGHFFRASEGEGGEWSGAGLDLILLALADARATRGAEDPVLKNLADELLDFYFNVYMKEKPRPLLTGAEIMKTFKIPEGKLVGEIIDKISEGVEKGLVSNKKEAVSFVKRWLASRGVVSGRTKSP